MTTEQIEAQQQLDEISSKLNDLWQQIREAEAEQDKLARIVYPEDYTEKVA